MRVRVCVFLAAVVTGAVAFAAIPGDLNHDGMVNEWDCQALSVVLSETFFADPETLLEADITEDGVVDIVDLLMLRLFLTPEYLPVRARCLYNGYFLTSHPRKAVEGDSTADRHRLYVLHALLIHPYTGRIIGTYPAMEGTPSPSNPVAKPLSEYPALALMEHPPSPGLSPSALAAYWQARGVPEGLLTGGQWVDLQGAVATPGLIDGHFHVTSWSRKLPPEGEQFGYWADVSDPKYYVNPGDFSRKCLREAMWLIVADANNFLRDVGRDQILLHGYTGTTTEEFSTSLDNMAFLYKRTGSDLERVFDPNFLLNRIGAIPAGPFTIPSNICTSDPATWPGQAYPSYRVLMVHTSGQSCWYNSALLDAFNLEARTVSAFAFGPVSVLEVTPPASGTQEWTFQVQTGTPAFTQLSEQTFPRVVDVVLNQTSPVGTAIVPFYMSSLAAATGTLKGRLVLADTLAELSIPCSSRTLVPFYRPIVESIPVADWNAAAAYYGKTPGSDPLGSGYWDPHNPYGTNWYNASDRGIAQYFLDSTAQAWRPTGYGEHYVFRDMLMSYAADPQGVEQCMQNRRNLAPWCHRHGLTGTQDIMFYRRDDNPEEFLACEGLSYNHRIAGGEDYYAESGVPYATPTGGLNLRVGMYYYLENAGEVTEILKLSEASESRRDVLRYRPPAAHPESPGWLEWTGWKLQMDGGPGSRTFFSSAAFPMTRITENTVTPLEGGGSVTFVNHTFGLLVTSNIPMGELSSRETGVLYWLVRESDPASTFYTGTMTGNYAFLKKGVMEWLNQTVDTATLSADLAHLVHVPGGTQAQRDQLAAKITTVLSQAKDAWKQTLLPLVKVWYETSRRSSLSPPTPSQFVCHCVGDAGVDLYVGAIKQLQADLANFPATWAELPDYWRGVVPADADLSQIRRTFENERFRIEHLLNVSCRMVKDIKGTGGIDASTTPDARNIVCSTQPALIALDGSTLRALLPAGQELWPIPHDDPPGTWLGEPDYPRAEHGVPLQLFRDQDMPLILNTDPPAVRDPRPAMTLIGAVARTPVERDPSHWVDQVGAEPETYPVDYLAGKAYQPWGLLAGTSTNPMALTLEQALTAMTFWGAYGAGWEDRLGAFALPATGSGSLGYFADVAVWMANPFAIKGPTGWTLEDLSRIPEGTDDASRVATLNAFIEKFRPTLTLVAGVPVYVRTAAGPWYPERPRPSKSGPSRPAGPRFQHALNAPDRWAEEGDVE
ncbi:MAG: hypothetical protein KA419_10120 [Acidobacteria bacterium]|nr:hypothetical protein [Acidobacteriota bacterium]